MEIYNGRVVQCTYCREIALFGTDDADIDIKMSLSKKGWIFDEFGNQFCISICQLSYQRECEHDKKYIEKLEDTVICKNCGKDFGGTIE